MSFLTAISTRYFSNHLKDGFIIAKYVNLEFNEFLDTVEFKPKNVSFS